MKLRRTWIPPHLRPYVAGSDIRAAASSNNQAALADIGSAEILIVASSDDGTAKYFYSLAQQRVKVIFVNLNEPRLLSILLSHILSGSIRPGIYFRSCMSSDIDVMLAQQAFSDFLHSYTGRVIHRSSERSSNFSKPLQLASMLNYDLVLRIPHTLIRTSSCPRYENNRHVAKSISACRSVVKDLASDTWGEGLFMMQELLHGQNVRVHCLGPKLFSWTIHTSIIDYRADPDTSLEEIELPPSVSEWCAQISKEEGLEFSGIDLILSQDQWFCFEVNPMPGYHYYETRLAIKNSTPITDALIELLVPGS